MAYNTTVKFFHSGMAGAPSLTGTAGAFIAMLDACLKDGFGSQTATSLTVSGGVATLNVPSTHPFDVHTVVLVAGSTPSGLNGQKRVLSSAANSITFDATGIADGTATGTITVKLAPAGWTKPFSGTNLAAYRVNGGTGAYLRVDDTGTANALVRAYEAMADVNTGTGLAPTVAQATNGYLWPKANAAAGASRPWIVIADEKTVWIKVCTVPSGSQNCGIIFGAGDFASRKPGDTYSFAIFGPTSDSSTQTSPAVVNYYGLAHGDYFGQTAYGVVLRSVSGVGTATPCYKRPEAYWAIPSSVISSSTYESGNAGLFTYPNPSDNSLMLTRMLVMDDVSLRGVLRGPLYTPHTIPSSGFAALTQLDGQGAMSGRKLLVVSGNVAAATAYDNRVMFFDITGPWE